MMGRCLGVLLPVALLLGGCGGDDEPAREPARAQLLRVYDAKAEAPADLRLRIPIQKGWSGASEKELELPIGGTIRKVDDSCELFLQLQADNGDGPVRLPGTRQVERGTRTLELDGRKLKAGFRLYRAENGLRLGIGSTGAGGALLLTMRDADTGNVVARLLALGGMDGLRCPFGPEEAIRRTFKVLRDMAQRTIVERVPQRKRS